MVGNVSLYNATNNVSINPIQHQINNLLLPAAVFINNCNRIIIKEPATV